MATYQDIVERGLRKVHVIALDETAISAELSAALDELNGMLHEWKLRGVNLEHTDGALGDAFPLGDEYVSGTVYMLASRLAPDYQVPVTFDADDFFRAIQAAYLTIDAVSFDKALTEPPSRQERDGTIYFYD